MISDLKVPTIHWNGTGKAALEGEYAQAVATLSAAIEAAKAITTHGRDYYVQSDPEAGPAAQKQQWFRLELLEKVRDEYLLILRGIQDQKACGS